MDWSDFLFFTWMGLCLPVGGSGRLKEPLTERRNEESALEANCETGDAASGLGEDEKSDDLSKVRTTLLGLKREVRTFTTLLEAGVKLSLVESERRNDGLGISSE